MNENTASGEQDFIHAKNTVNTGDQHDSSTSTRSAFSAYVRPPKPRKTQAAIDDLAYDDPSDQKEIYTHESNFSVRRKTPFSGLSYRRTRANVQQLQKASPYGQYLQSPKGNRSIFVSRERQNRRKSLIALALIIALILIVLIIAIRLILNFG